MKINDFKELSDKELNELIETLSSEQKTRKETKQKELWGNVTRAVQEYLEEFNSITLEDACNVIVIFKDHVDYCANGPGSIGYQS